MMKLPSGQEWPRYQNTETKQPTTWKEYIDMKGVKQTLPTHTMPEDHQAAQDVPWHMQPTRPGMGKPRLPAPDEVAKAKVKADSVIRTKLGIGAGMTPARHDFRWMLFSVHTNETLMYTTATKLDEVTEGFADKVAEYTTARPLSDLRVCFIGPSRTLVESEPRARYHLKYSK